MDSEFWRNGTEQSFISQVLSIMVNEIEIEPDFERRVA